MNKHDQEQHDAEATENPRDPQAHEEPVSEPPPGGEPEGQAEPDAEGGDQPSPLQAQVDQLTGELDELNNRLLRVSADYQNYARRSERNITDARQQQLAEVARALLPVLDHFDQALQVDPAAGAESVLQGVKIVHDELVKTLRGFGVERIDAVAGDEFDPERHEALMRQQAEGVEPNQVVTQLRPGYALGERTLRPAQVSVASE